MAQMYGINKEDKKEDKINVNLELLEKNVDKIALLTAITQIYQNALIATTQEELGRICLNAAKEMTQSKFGFIGELNAETGLLDDIAISNAGWDEWQIEIKTGHKKKIPIHIQIPGLYGHVLSQEKSFFTNNPSEHVESTGIPLGHPSIASFLGSPLFLEGRINGLVGLANREGGYGIRQQTLLDALAPTMAKVFITRRAQKTLSKSEELYRTLVKNLPDVAVFVVDKELR